MYKNLPCYFATQFPVKVYLMCTLHWIVLIKDMFWNFLSKYFFIHDFRLCSWNMPTLFTSKLYIISVNSHTALNLRTTSHYINDLEFLAINIIIIVSATISICKLITEAWQLYWELGDLDSSLAFSYLTVYQFSHSVVSNSMQPNGLQHARLPCPSPAPGVCSNSCPSSQWCHPTISSSVVLFSSCLQSFPASESFPVSHFFASGGQSIWESASVILNCV